MNERQGLSEAVVETIAILTRGSESVRAVLMGEENRFSNALLRLKELAENENVPIAIVGGLGAIRYGYPAATQDIDIVIGKNDLDRVVLVAPRYGLKVAWEAKTGWHTFTHGDVEINVVPEGGKARKTSPTTIPGPAALGVERGLEYASVAGWMELKLSSGRQKDTGHVVEVLKKFDDAEYPALRQRIASVHNSYAELLDELHAKAIEEREQEDSRME